MRCQNVNRVIQFCLMIACLALVSTAYGQGINNPVLNNPTGGPALVPAAPTAGAVQPGTIAGPDLRIQDLRPAPQGQHPLTPIVAIARSGLNRIDTGIQDYKCTLYKRERIGGTLGGYEAMDVKIRQKPFSVYMKFQYPTDKKDTEVIYAQGKNNGNMLAHAGSGIRARFGMVQLAPTSFLAMKDNRYPITEVGIANLTKRLIDVGEQDLKFGECNVKFENTAIALPEGKRPVTMIVVEHPERRRNFLFYQAKICVDHELQIPIRYEAYDWPAQPGAPAPLVEEYTYGNIQVNVGLTDSDFEMQNPAYRFVAR